MTLQRFFKKLRLKPGDALLVREPLIDINQLMRLGQEMRINYNVPIICAHNKNNIQRLPFEELEKQYLMAKAAKEGKIYE